MKSSRPHQQQQQQHQQQQQQHARLPSSASARGSLASLDPGDVVLVELLNSCECAICLEVFLNPVVGCCGHSFCFECIAAMFASQQSRSCPICRGDFGELENRPPNILVKSLITFYFPIEMERRRIGAEGQQGRLALQHNQPQPHRAMMLRPGGGAVVAAAGGGPPPSWNERLMRLIRPLWPLVRFAPALLYPLFLLMLFVLVFKGKQARRRR